MRLIAGCDEVLRERAARLAVGLRVQRGHRRIRADVHDRAVDLGAADERVQSRVEGVGGRARQRQPAAVDEDERPEVRPPATGGAPPTWSATPEHRLPSRATCERELAVLVERAVLALHADVEEPGVVPGVHRDALVTRAGCRGDGEQACGLGGRRPFPGRQGSSSTTPSATTDSPTTPSATTQSATTQSATTQSATTGVGDHSVGRERRRAPLRRRPLRRRPLRRAEDRVVEQRRVPVRRVPRGRVEPPMC